LWVFENYFVGKIKEWEVDEQYERDWGLRDESLKFQWKLLGSSRAQTLVYFLMVFCSHSSMLSCSLVKWIKQFQRHNSQGNVINWIKDLMLLFNWMKWKLKKADSEREKNKRSKSGGKKMWSEFVLIKQIATCWTFKMKK
jgi:hypothetical protein